MDKSDDGDLKSNIFHYFRQKLYNHMLNASKEGISKFKGDVSYHLYHSLALMLVNRLEEGIHDLETIRMENDVKLAVAIALMYGHKLLGVTNNELFTALDGQMREYRRHSEAIDFYHSAFVLVCLNKPEKALDYAEKALTMQSSLSECLTLKGWILLQLRRTGKKATTNLKDIFQTSLQQNPRNLYTIIGLTECYLLQNDFPEALNIINKAVVRYTSTSLPLMQKIRIHLAAVDWDQALETIYRIITTDAKNLYARRMLVIIHICRSADFSNADIEFKKYVNLLETTEPGNVQLMLETAQLFSKSCMRSVGILLEVKRMLEVVLQNNPENAEVVVELGFQAILRIKNKTALRYFKSATKIDDTSVKALLGLSLCELLENGTCEQLRNQIAFLMEIKDAQESLLLKFIRAKISPTERALKYLNTICETTLSRLESCPFSDTYLMILDLEFMAEVLRESMRHLSVHKDSSDGIYAILKVILKVCPGMSEALFLMAKLQYIRGDYTDSMANLETIFIDVASVFPQYEARLLMARIQVQHGLFDRAAQTLEVAVSSNFKVREHPLYHYIAALVEKNTNNFADAIKSLTTALSLASKPREELEPNVSLMEKACMYVELIDILNIVGQSDEAAKILEEATEELRNTPEEAKILFLTAEHLLKRKKVQETLDLLSRIKPTDSCYKEAKSRYAEVLLDHMKDKYAYLQCYLDSVDENPGAESYEMLGDAYMAVLEPDEALESYEKALKEKPKDQYLISKLGKALVDTHYFSRAVNYYKKAIQNTNDSELKLELAELYMNLKEFDKGELLLLNELEDENVINLEDLTYLRFKTRLLNLLAQIQEKSGNTTYAVKSLRDAMDNQNRIRKRLTIEQNPVPEEEIKILVEISMKLGEMAISLKNNEQAVNYYKDGLEVSPNNVTLLVALAKLYMQMNYLELCQQTSANVLRLDPENESASVMMADIAFRKVDFDMALFHFTQLVIKQPTNWEALIRLIEIHRRTGNIEDCKEYLNTAEQKCENPTKEAGYLYCTALYQLYSSNLNGALRSFNSARPDQKFGQMAIYNMIEICLNPDDEILGDQFMESDDIEYRDSRSIALKTADRLLKELKMRLEANGDDLLRHRLLSNFRLLATKEKHNIERALDDFVSLASESAYRDHIGITLGIATAYSLLKQGQRAKNQLKRIVKTTWTFEDAEYLESCWLLLSDYYIQSAKFENATELINKVVQHNKACTKAYEYLGFIAEKEQRYKDGANFYEQAFKYGGYINPTVGYKLAHCLMKCKKYPDTISVAQEVLKLNPDYPRIKKDILDKSMNNLRT